jgi:DNA-binding PadR family transcriptional regulator
MTEKNDESKTETAPLPTTAYILLGALTFQPRSGYELKALLDRSVRHFYWSPAQSQIYTDLRRLVERGLVTVEDVPQTHRPDKRIYTITPSGREVVQQWLEYGKVEPDVYKSAFQLRLFFGYLLSRPRLLSLIDEQRRWLVRSILILEEAAQELERRRQGPPPAEHFMFPLLEIELKLASFRAELAWADQALARLAP